MKFHLPPSLALFFLSTFAVATGLATNLTWGTAAGTWSTATSDTPWAGTLPFANNDAVTFDGGAGHIVTIHGTVTPATINVSHTAGMYTFKAGDLTSQITGAGGITKTGAGLLSLDLHVGGDTPNPFANLLAFSGDVNINEGEIMLGTSKTSNPNPAILLITNGNKTFNMGTGAIRVSSGATFSTALGSSSDAVAIMTNQVYLADSAKLGSYYGNVNWTGTIHVTGTVTYAGAMQFGGGTTRFAGGLQGGSSAIINFDKGSGTFNNPINVRISTDNTTSFLGTLNLNGGTANASNMHMYLEHSNAVAGGTVNLTKHAVETSTVTARLIFGVGSLNNAGNAASTNTNAAVAPTFVNNVTLGGLTGNAGTEVVYGDAATNGTLTINNAVENTFSGAIRGMTTAIDPKLSVTKSGAGKLILGGANLFTGTLTVNTGEVELNETGSLATQTINFLNNGKFTYNKTGTITIGSGLTLTGAGRLEYAGGATYTVEGTNKTYSGGTTVRNSHLVYADASSLGATSSNINLIGSSIEYTGSTALNSAHQYTLSGANTIKTQISNLTINTAITNGDATGSLIKDGSMNLTLTAQNTYTGGTTVSAGKLVLDYNTAGGSVLSSTGALTLGSGTLELLSTTTANQTVSSTSIIGDAILDLTNSSATTLNLGNLTGTGSLHIDLGATDTPVYSITVGTVDSGTLANITFTSNGRTAGAVLSGNQLVMDGNTILVIPASTTHTINGPGDVGFSWYTSVINNGNLAITNLGVSDNLNIYDLSGTNTSATITTDGTVATGSTITLTNQTGTTNKNYAGSIIATDSTLVKGGDSTFNSTIGNHVEVANLKVDTGSLTINGNNGSGTPITSTVSGTTTIAAGTSLNLGSTSTLTTTDIAGTGNVNLSNSTLQVTPSAPSVLDTNVQGTGTLKIAGGTISTGAGAIGNNVTIDVTNSSTFNATVSKSVGAISGTGTVDVNKGNTLELKGSDTTIFSGSLTSGGASSGAGTINHSGTGTQTFATAGDSNISLTQTGSGITKIDNTTASTWKDLSATQGTLSIAGTTGAQALVTTDTLSLSSTGTLSLDITSATNGAAPFINVNTALTLASGSTVSLNSVGTASNWTLDNYSFTLINSTDPTAASDGFHVQLNGILKDLGYVINNVVYGNSLIVNLIMGTSSIQKAANSFNTTQVATLLWDNRSAIPVGGELSTIYATLMDPATSPEQRTAGLQSFAGSSITALMGSTRDGLNQQVLTIRNRVTHMGTDQNYFNTDLPYTHLWIQANGAWKDVDQDGDEAGYSMDTWGGTVGCDVDVTEAFTVGGAITANYSKIHTSSYDQADGNNDAVYANIFGRYQRKKWTHISIITGGWNDMDLDRTVSIGDLRYKTTGNTTAATFGAYYECTYDVALNKQKTAYLQPLVSASIYNSGIEGYTETGAGSASMRIDDQNATYGTVGIGARILGNLSPYALGRLTTGEIRMQIVQDYGDTDSEVHLSPVGLPNAGLRVRGAEVGSTGIQIGASINIPVNNQSAFFINGDVDFRSGATSLSGNIGYRYDF